MLRSIDLIDPLNGFLPTLACLLTYVQITLKFSFPLRNENKNPTKLDIAYKSFNSSRMQNDHPTKLVIRF